MPDGKVTCCIIIGKNFPSYAQSWNKLGAGIDGFNRFGEGIYSIYPGKTGNLFEAGWLTDTTLSNNAFVDMWNGTSWAYVGAGSSLLDSFLYTTQVITDTSGNVYMIGVMKSVSYQNVVKWDGTSWTKVGALNADSTIYTIYLDKSGNLYAGGSFTDSTTGAVGHPYIAKWDGTSWSELGTGTHALNANGVIYALCADTFGNVYAAGHFTDTSGKYYVAKWNGSAWSELGTGSDALNANNMIQSICSDVYGNVYAAGWFTNTSGMYYAAKWNGSAWNELGTGSTALNANGFIKSLCLDVYGNLYAAGLFTNSTSTYYVAKWNGLGWSELGTGSDALRANDEIMSVSSDAYGNIYAGGLFTDTTTSLYDTSGHLIHPCYIAEYSATTSIVPIRSVTGINVYPNPTNNTLVITNVLQNTIYCLVNVAGECIQQGNLNPGNSMVTMNNFAPGVYILEMTSVDGGRDVVKVVKE